jgi:hypothetical protein
VSNFYDAGITIYGNGDGNLIQKADETAIPKRRDCRFSLSVFNGFGQKM